MVWVGAIVANPFTTHISDRTYTYSLHRSNSHWALRPTRPRASQGAAPSHGKYVPRKKTKKKTDVGRFWRGDFFILGHVPSHVSKSFALYFFFIVVSDFLGNHRRYVIFEVLFACSGNREWEGSNKCTWICHSYSVILTVCVQWILDYCKTINLYQLLS